MSSGGEITKLLAAMKHGDTKAESNLVALVYDELNRLAHRYMRHERPDHTLQPTALVNEAYLRLMGADDKTWNGRAHFFATLGADQPNLCEAIELPPGQREEFLRRECMNDAEYDTVSRMVEEHFRESGPLDDRPTWPSSHARPVCAEEQIVARRYRVIRFIGRGGMGEVYEVEDQELKERVALKTLLPEIGADEHMITRFKQEIQLSRRIGHPNVCRMFDLARHDSVVFLTMELLEGEPLSETLRCEGRLAPDAALPPLEQMAAGLDAVHRAGIIHRDLKPSNVMLAGRG